MNASYNNRKMEYERATLIESLKKKGIGDEAVLAAMVRLPRHAFITEAFMHRAYEDNALPIDCQQTISQPYTVAFMTQLLQLRDGDKVLEIGTGSGYQACLLAEMNTRVFTIERHFDLLEQARKRFEQLGYNIASKVGDGSIGWSQFAPYEKIIVTAGAPEVPRSLSLQLTDGGIMVIPVGDELRQTMIVVRREGDEFTQRNISGFKFVPLIGKEGWRK